MNAWALLAAAILSEVTATLSLRGALDRPALYAVVVAGYVISFALLGQVLRRGMSLGVAYGVWGASGVVLAATGSAILFGEVLTAVKITGFVLIAAGVVVVEVGSQRARRAAGPSAAEDVAPIHSRVPTAELPVLTEHQLAEHERAGHGSAPARGTEER